MKYVVQSLKLICMVMLCVCFILSCRKTENESGQTPVISGSSATADSISDHLQFFNATKKQGTIPKGPSGSSLKISFEDTLYLLQQIKMPIKFLHKGTTQ